jgi:hypothetical protein
MIHGLRGMLERVLLSAGLALCSWAQTPAPRLAGLVEFPLREDRDSPVVGRVVLNYGATTVTGSFEAEMVSDGYLGDNLRESAAKRLSVTGSFDNGRYGVRVNPSPFGNPEVAPPRPDAPVDFVASGTYKVFVEYPPPSEAPMLGGTQKPPHVHECRFEIRVQWASYRDQSEFLGFWQIMIASDILSPYPRDRIRFCAGHVGVSFFTEVKVPARPAVTSPKPVAGACPIESELATLKSLADSIVAQQIANNSAAAMLVVQRIIIEQARLKIADLQRKWMTSSAATSLFEPMDHADIRFQPFAEKFQAIQATHERVIREQDELLAKSSRDRAELMQRIQTAVDSAKCPDVKRALMIRWMDLEDSRTYSEAFLYFSAGQSERFRQLAEEGLGKKKFLYQIYWLMGQDYSRTGQMGSSLVAFRNSHIALKEELEKLPADEVPKELAALVPQIEALIQELEVKYLETIDRKVMGDAANVRALMAAELARGETGWNLLTTGVPTWLGGIGRYGSGESGVEARADMLGTILEESSGQHAGLNAILRLRAKGHSLIEIQRATNSTILEWFAKDFPKFKMDARKALNLRSWIYQGFQNPDVIRLMAGSLEGFQTEQGGSYYTQAEFEQTWYEAMGESTLNPLSAFLMLAPAAKVTSATGAFLAVPRLMSAAELATCSSLLQVTGRVLRIPQLWSRLSASNSFAGEQVRALIKWNYDASLMKKLFVQGLAQNSVIQVASAVGGLPGQVIADLLTTIGAGSLDDAALILRNAGVSRAAAQALVDDLEPLMDKVAGLRLESRIVSYKDRIVRALEKIDAGEVIEEGLKSEFRAASQSLDDLAKRTANEAGSDLVRLQSIQLRLTSASLRSLSMDDIPRARWLALIIDETDEKISQMTMKIQQGVKVAEATGKISNVPMGDPDLPDKLEGAAPPTPTDRACKQVTETLNGHGAKYQAADEAFRAGKFDEAISHYQTTVATLDEALERAIAAGDTQKLRDIIQDLSENIESYAIVRDTRVANSHIKPFGDAAEDVLTKDVSPAEAGPAKAELERIYQLVKGKTGRELENALEPHLPRLKTSSGEVTKDVPRLLRIGDQKWVVKDYMQNALGPKDELFATKVANKLNVTTPGCGEIQWVDGDGARHHGLLQRYVANKSDLGSVDRGTALAVKKHIAKDRAVAFLLGDHDRRSRNFLVTADGRVYCIDRAESSIIDRFTRWRGEVSSRTAQEVIDAMAERRRIYKIQVERMWPIIEAADRLITPEELAEAAKAVKQLSDDYFRGLIKEVFGFTEDSMEFRQALQTLTVRRDNIDAVLTPLR